MLERSDDVSYWIDFFKYLHSSGVVTLHSSFEYDSFDLLVQVLKELEVQGIFFDHIVKLPEPGFNEINFDVNKFYLRLREYKNQLPGEIVKIQWLWRSNVTEDMKLESFQDDWESISLAFGHLPVSCFPYTKSFAKLAIESGLFDSLFIYWNENEQEFSDLFDDFHLKNINVFVIRPFAAGAIRDVTTALDFCNRVPNLSGIVFTATSRDHLEPVIRYFASYDYI